MFGRKNEAVAPLVGEQIMRRPLHSAGSALGSAVHPLDHPCDCGQTTIGACSQMDARHCGARDEEEAPAVADPIEEAPQAAAVPGPLDGPDWIQTIVEARDVLNAAERLGLIKLQVGEAFVGQLEVFKLTPKVVHTVEEELLP